MTTLRLILLGAVFTQLISVSTVQAQMTARRLTRRIAPQGGAGQTNAAGAKPAPAPLQAPSSITPAPTAPTNARPAPAYAPVRIVQPPADPEKARAAKEEALRKTVEFQKQRAKEGSESAQYELGMRYLKGDGVEKDEAAGRKWLTEASKNGYGPATQRLEELDKPPASAKELKTEK